MSNETVKEETIKADPIFDEAKDESELQNDIKAGEWQKLRQFETYKRRSRQGRIIATHQAVCNRIKQLETLFYQLVRNHPAKAVKLLNFASILGFSKTLFLIVALSTMKAFYLFFHSILDT